MPRDNHRGLSPNIRQQKTDEFALETIGAAHSPWAGSSPARSSTPGEKKLPCPICRASGIMTGADRPHDFKTHLKNFHCTDTVWVCPSPGCGLFFDLKEAYKKHAMAERNGRGVSERELKEAMVDLSPPLVFACGFASCHHKTPVFEAKDEQHATAAASDFIAHIMEHILKDRSADRAEWERHVEVGNLMCQRSLKGPWFDSATEQDRTQYQFEHPLLCEFKGVLQRRGWKPSEVPDVIRTAHSLGSGSVSLKSGKPQALPPTLRLLLQPNATASQPIEIPSQAPPTQSPAQNNPVRTVHKIGRPSQRIHPSRTSSLPHSGPGGSKQPPQQRATVYSSVYSQNSIAYSSGYSEYVNPIATAVGPANCSTTPMGFSMPMHGSSQASWSIPQYMEQGTLVPSQASTNVTSHPGGIAAPQVDNGMTVVNPMDNPVTTPPLHTLQSNSTIRPNFSRPRKSQENLRAFARPQSVVMADYNDEVPPMPTVDEIALMGARASGAVQNTSTGGFSAHPPVRQTQSRHRKSYENLRVQSRPVSVVMADPDAPPVPSLGEATQFDAGVDPTFQGITYGGTSNMAGYRML